MRGEGKREVRFESRNKVSGWSWDRRKKERHVGVLGEDGSGENEKKSACVWGWVGWGGGGGRGEGERGEERK